MLLTAQKRRNLQVANCYISKNVITAHVDVSRPDKHKRNSVYTFPALGVGGGGHRRGRLGHCRAAANKLLRDTLGGGG